MLELVSEEQVFNAVKSNGPLIPLDVRQLIKMGDSIIIGATLSTLVDRKLVKVTHIKRGGSPFYYVVGQEEKLSDLSKFLGEKDKKVFDLLKQKQVIRDAIEEPLVRVALRNLPDFSKKLDLEINGVKEIFWRWYMITDDEAIQILTKKSKEKGIEKVTDVVETSKGKDDKKEKEDITEDKKSAVVNLDDKSKTEVKVKPHRKKSESKEETEEFIEQKAEVQQAVLTSAGQNPNLPVIISQFNDSFINKIGEFFVSSSILVREAKQIKKGADYELIIDMPTPVGSVEYFCKVRSKKKCNEGDLSSAYVQSQKARLPILFITTGEVAKKAKDKLKVDFKGMIIKEL